MHITGSQTSKPGIEQFEAFLNNYYLDGDPRDAEPFLRIMLQSTVFSHWFDSGKSGPMPYFFFRIAQLHPPCWQAYADVLQQADGKGCLFILWIFSLEKPELIRQYLTPILIDPRYSDLSGEVENIIKSGGNGRNILDWNVPSSPEHLDCLWGEFLITGNKDAVRGIVSVLERTDLVRNKLDKSLLEMCAEEFGGKASCETLGTQLLNFDIVIDCQDETIVSRQDLDFSVMMDGCNYDQARLDNSKRILPIKISSADLAHIAMKSSAKWSLYANAGSHPLVLETCQEEAASRSGSVRLSLLEIITRVLLERDELENAWKTYYESLIWDPERRAATLRQAEGECDQLAALNDEIAVTVGEKVADIEAIITACIEGSEHVSSYYTRMVMESSTTAPDDKAQISWQMEYCRPHRYRVVQLAGEDVDEWIAVGDLLYRGPMMMRITDAAAGESERSVNETLSLVSILGILRGWSPDSAQRTKTSTGEFLTLDYPSESARDVLFKAIGDQNPDVSLVRAWIHCDNKRLVKLQIDWHAESGEGNTEEMCVIHHFSGYDSEINIIPPPFQIFCEETEDNQESMLERLEQQRSKIRWIGTLGGVGFGGLIGVGFILNAPTTDIADIIYHLVIPMALSAVFGFYLADIVRLFMPGQRELTRIKKEQNEGKK